MSPLASYVVQTSLTLVAVAVLAALVVYGSRRAGWGRSSGQLELRARLPLDARRAVYVVKVGRAEYVLGGSEAGLVKLGEIPENPPEEPRAENSGDA